MSRDQAAAQGEVGGMGGGELLSGVDLPAGDAHGLPPAPGRFDDGAHYRLEIPSVEGPRCLAAVLAEAERYEVPVVRVSQGSGIGLLTDSEIGDMVVLAAESGVELSLYARPCADQLAAVRGADQLAAVLDEICRAADLGVRSVVLADIGALSVFGQLRAAGTLPADMQAKVSVELPVSNPATARVLAGLGADTLSLPTDLALAQIGAIRAAVQVPLDVYVEAPDHLGGFVRHYELARLVSLAAPVHLTVGLRNAPDVHPAGSHLEELAVALSVERVRRARLALDLLGRAGSEAATSKPGAPGLAVPVRPRGS